MSKGNNIKNSIITDSFNKYIYIGKYSNIKGFLNQIDGRKKELDLLGENYYVSLDFSEGLNIESLLEEDRCIVIGNPGSGKTQLLVDIFLRIKNTLNKRLWFYKSNDFLPFFIALRNLQEDSLEEYLDKKIVKFNIKGEQKFILLLDGLDEINSDKLFEVLNFIENNQNYKYIISSRKTSINLGQLLSKYSDFKQYIIEEFNFDLDKGGSTEILENYFQKKGKKIDLEKYKKLQIEIKDIFYLEQFFEEYENLEEKDLKLELTEKFLKDISNKNDILIKFEIDINELFGLLTKVSEFLYKSNSLILEKEKIQELILSISIQENKRKLFLDYILKTFFIESEGKYSFYHKTFYEYFLVRYISNEYFKNKLSIREGNILFDETFIKKWFFPYLQKEYVKNENYAGVIGLNLFMDYYLKHNPIDEIKPEIFIKGLFDLPEDILRGYILEKTSPIYNWFKGFYYLNFTTIKIALDKGYKDIADGFYDILNNLLEEKTQESKNIEERLGKLDIGDEEYNFNKSELELELNHLFDGIDFKDKAYLKKYYKEYNSYFDLYEKIKSKYKIYIYKGIDLNSDFFNSPYYAFFDNLLKAGNQEEILKVINELEKVEYYAFLQVGLKLENIKIILGNVNILNFLKEKFTSYNGDFKEFINYREEDLKIKDSAITLFLKYIFGLYKNEDEIFESGNFKELKEGSNGFFNIHWGFYESNLNSSQLASYIFIEKIKFDINEEHHLSQNRMVYQYSYYLYLKSILNEEKIKFDEYIINIKNYLSIPTVSSKLNININKIYSEILAYIFYYNVEGDYLKNVNLIWDNLCDFINEINFYKTLYKLDELNNTEKLKEIINNDKINSLKEEIVKVFDYPASEVEDYIFISQLYGLKGNKDLQIKSFDSGIAHSYIKYGFRKDYYLTYVFEILEDLKHNSVITEEKTFEYLNEIIDIYGKIDGITEKGVAYLGKSIINFLLIFSLDKAIEYKEKLDDINYSYNDEIKTNILIHKIKNNNFIEDDIENLYFHDSRTSLLELKIYVYLVANGREEFIDKVNDLIEEVKDETSIYYYWTNEDYKTYDNLYKLRKINKSELILKELEKPEREINEIFSLKDLNDDEIIEILNDKVCYNMYHTSFSGDYNYLLSELYNKDKDLFNKYISGTKFKFSDSYEYEFFTNIQGVIKTYISNNEKNKAILLFEEMLSFAGLLIR